jgi:hypothetical protein
MIEQVDSMKVTSIDLPVAGRWLVVDLEGGVSLGDPRVIGSLWNRSPGIVARLIQWRLSSRFIEEERC